MNEIEIQFLFFTLNLIFHSTINEVDQCNDVLTKFFRIAVEIIEELKLQKHFH